MSDEDPDAVTVGAVTIPGSRRCISTNRTTGQRCKQAAVKGTTVCRFHGGAAPQVRAAAARRVAEQEVGEMVERLTEEMRQAPGGSLAAAIGLPVDNDTPAEALAKAAAAARGTVNVLRQVARDSADFDNPSYPVTVIVMRMLGEWEDRAARFAEMEGKLGVAVRTAGVAEGHLSISQVKQLRELSKDPVMAEQMASIAGMLRPILEGETAD